LKGKTQDGARPETRIEDTIEETIIETPKRQPKSPTPPKPTPKPSQENRKSNPVVWILSGIAGGIAGVLLVLFMTGVLSTSNKENVPSGGGVADTTIVVADNEQVPNVSSVPKVPTTDVVADNEQKEKEAAAEKERLAREQKEKEAAAEKERLEREQKEKEAAVEKERLAREQKEKAAVAEPVMVKVEGGTFTMGCTSEQGSGCLYDEKPAHSVTVSSFSIGKYEVTQALWKASMGTTIRQQRDKTDSDKDLSGEGDNYPMYYVSWYEAQEFIKRLNAATGKRYRLPTEAEWEYAARGGNRSQGYKYSGSNNLDEVAWYTDNSGDKAHPVGTKKANELGIHDMTGNVWEWCQDRYGDYSASSQQNPVGASSGSDRVNRGGGWNYAFIFDCRVANRNSRSPGDRGYNLGFRVVLP
jgi:formylglycine-generating enzyme required for sulfatase activity